MEIIVLGLNRFGEEVYSWLLEETDAEVLALVTDESQYDTIRTLEPDLLISAGFRHIIPDDILSIPKEGAINLHPSYLPYNRGANPNVWSIIEDAPAGVSVHYMTPDLDAGPIIGRRKVSVKPDDDGRSLYRRLEHAQIDLFKSVWPDIKDGSVETVEQTEDNVTSHKKRDFSDLFEIDLDEKQQAGDLIDRLRALTFPPYNNAYFEKNGQRYYVEVEITPENEVEESDGIHFNVPDY
jgi:methionyl-tRNA formyltransferase